MIGTPAPDQETIVSPHQAEAPDSTRDRLAFDSYGTGRPVVLLHAFPLDRTMWRPVVEQAQGLAEGLQLIVPDLRGFGSSPSANGEAIAMRRYGADVVALLDHLGLSKVTICGLSLGGYVALAIAETYPERVDALILANTRASGDDPEARGKRLALAVRVGEEGIVVLSQDLEPKLLGPEADAEALALVSGVVSRQDPRGAQSALRGMAERADRNGMLGTITVATLVITSEHDNLVPPPESRAMAAAIPGSILVEIPGAGHLSAVEQPAAFLKALADLLLVARPS